MQHAVCHMLIMTHAVKHLNLLNHVQCVQMCAVDVKMHSKHIRPCQL